MRNFAREVASTVLSPIWKLVPRRIGNTTSGTVYSTDPVEGRAP